MKYTTSIVIINGAIDEFGDKLIVRGVVDPGCLHLLKVDDYQREAMPLSSQSTILEALSKKETLPDIELGMRGDRVREEEAGRFILLDPVYIIDGLQRVSTARHFMQANPGAEPRLGATVHFDTNKTWERERFRTLNTSRLKVSPNVILRNHRDESPAIQLLYSLCEDKSFVMHGRVSWSQRMARGELISALMFAKVSGLLHSHKAPTKRTSIEELVPALEKMIEVFGVNIVRDNIRTLFELIDICWGIRRVQYREGSCYMRGNFLAVLAMILSDHHDFWKQPDEKRLMIEADLKRKLTTFPVHDPQVINLAGSGGKSREMLYMLMTNHINSGKRTRRLSSRSGGVMTLGESEEES